MKAEFFVIQINEWKSKCSTSKMHNVPLIYREYNLNLTKQK